MIQIRDITKRYGDRIVLDVKQLDLEAGGITALIGPNGAGKSTLLSVMARLTPERLRSVAATSARPSPQSWREPSAS